MELLDFQGGFIYLAGMLCKVSSLSIVVCLFFSVPCLGHRDYCS